MSFQVPVLCSPAALIKASPPVWIMIIRGRWHGLTSQRKQLPLAIVAHGASYYISGYRQAALVSRNTQSYLLMKYYFRLLVTIIIILTLQFLLEGHVPSE